MKDFWFWKPIWQGRVYFTSALLEIHNLIAGWRSSVCFNQSPRIVSFCSSTQFVFLLLDDDTVLGLKETDSGSFRIHKRWTRNDEGSYRPSDMLIPASVSIAEDPLAVDSFSHFGLSFEEGNPDAPGKTIKSPPFGCTERHVYIAYRSVGSSLINRYCQININTNEVVPTADFLPPAVSISRIECGYAHVVLLDSTGSVHTFGCGTHGELGHGDLESRTSPKLVEALVGVRIRVIAVGGWHTVAVTEFGDAYVWGWNNDCQIGFDNDSSPVVVEPQHLEFPGDVLVISSACGSRHSVFLLDNGDVYGCGWNGYKQLGQTTSGVNKLFQIDCNQQTDKPIVALSAGAVSTVLYY